MGIKKILRDGCKNLPVFSFHRKQTELTTEWGAWDHDAMLRICRVEKRE